MIDKELVEVGRRYRYPTPGGEGTTVTTVVDILRPTEMFPSGRVVHESDDIGMGAVVPMEDFCEVAESIKDP